MARIMRAIMQNKRVRKPRQEKEAHAEHGGDERGLERLGARGGDGPRVQCNGMRIHKTSLAAPPAALVCHATAGLLAGASLPRAAFPISREISGLGTLLDADSCGGSCAPGAASGRPVAFPLRLLAEDRRLCKMLQGPGGVKRLMT
jgi:hypothetical protein